MTIIRISVTWIGWCNAHVVLQPLNQLWRWWWWLSVGWIYYWWGLVWGGIQQPIVVIIEFVFSQWWGSMELGLVGFHRLDLYCPGSYTDVQPLGLTHINFSPGDFSTKADIGLRLVRFSGTANILPDWWYSPSMPITKYQRYQTWLKQVWQKW